MLLEGGRWVLMEILREARALRYHIGKVRLQSWEKPGVLLVTMKWHNEC